MAHGDRTTGGPQARRPGLVEALEDGRLTDRRQDRAGVLVQGQATLFLKENGVVGRRGVFDAAVPVLAGFKKMMGFVF